MLTHRNNLFCRVITSKSSLASQKRAGKHEIKIFHINLSLMNTSVFISHHYYSILLKSAIYTASQQEIKRVGKAPWLCAIYGTIFVLHLTKYCHWIYAASCFATRRWEKKIDFWKGLQFPCSFFLIYWQHNELIFFYDDHYNDIPTLNSLMKNLILAWIGQLNVLHGRKISRSVKIVKFG